MMKRYEESVKFVVNTLKDFGFDYGVSKRIKRELDMLCSVKELPTVMSSFTTKESEDTLSRNLMIDFVINAYKEEDEIQRSAQKATIFEDMEFYELLNVDVVNRNDFLFKSQLKSTINHIKEDFEYIDSLYYGLEEKFKANFGRVPKLMKEVKTAAYLSNCTSEEVVKSFDMKTINCLKNKGLKDINIFMFVFKNPFMKKGDIMNLDKRFLLNLSRCESNEDIRAFRAFLVEREGVKNGLRIYEYTMTEDYIGLETKFNLIKDKIDIVANVAKTSEILDMLKYNDFNSIEKMFSGKYFGKVKSGELTLSEAVALSKSRYDIKEIMRPHDLKGTSVRLGRETAGIMAWDDIRQFFLGDYTHCCQTFGEAGETSMLFGLYSKHSGFFSIERDEKVLAQAWVWEAKNDTLVLDNIELADCRDVEQFTNILYKWAESSPYRNIQLGLGYSDMTLGVPMTKGEINYYSLFRSRAFTKSTKSFFKNKRIYTDAQCKRNWLKKDGAMQFDKVIDINDTDALAERALRIERLVAEISVTNE